VHLVTMRPQNIRSINSHMSMPNIIDFDFVERSLSTSKHLLNKKGRPSLSPQITLQKLAASHITVQCPSLLLRCPVLAENSSSSPPPGVVAIRSPFSHRLRKLGDLQVFTADPSEEPADFGPSLVEATSPAAGGSTLLPQAIWFGIRRITESSLRILRLEDSPSRVQVVARPLNPFRNPPGGTVGDRRSVVIAGGQAGGIIQNPLREVCIDGGGPPRSARGSASC
jgi:hypothetical protein